MKNGFKIESNFNYIRYNKTNTKNYLIILMSFFNKNAIKSISLVN